MIKVNIKTIKKTVIATSKDFGGPCISFLLKQQKRYKIGIESRRFCG